MRPDPLSQRRGRLTGAVCRAGQRLFNLSKDLSLRAGRSCLLRRAGISMKRTYRDSSRTLPTAAELDRLLATSGAAADMDNCRIDPRGMRRSRRWSASTGISAGPSMTKPVPRRRRRDEGLAAAELDSAQEAQLRIEDALQKACCPRPHNIRRNLFPGDPGGTGGDEAACSLATCCACIPATRNASAGRSRPSRPATLGLGASKGSHRAHCRQRCLLAPQVRVRRSSGAAGADYRTQGRIHVGLYRGGDARADEVGDVNQPICALTPSGPPVPVVRHINKPTRKGAYATCPPVSSRCGTGVPSTRTRPRPCACWRPGSRTFRCASSRPANRHPQEPGGERRSFGADHYHNFPRVG